MKCNLFPFFLLFVVGGGGGGISGRVRALNLTVPLGSGRVGSDDLGYGPGSGFSFEPVQTSTMTTLLTLTRCHLLAGLISLLKYLLLFKGIVHLMKIISLIMSCP